MSQLLFLLPHINISWVATKVAAIFSRFHRFDFTGIPVGLLQASSLSVFRYLAVTQDKTQVPVSALQDHSFLEPVERLGLVSRFTQSDGECNLLGN